MSMKETNINAIKNDFLKYLEDEIKETPDEFKKLVDCIVKFYKDCATDLGILVSFDFDCWGDCIGLRARLAEWDNNPIPENEYMVLSASTITNLSYKNINSLVSKFCKGRYNEDEAFELYGILLKDLESDEKFNEYKSLYKYYIIAISQEIMALARVWEIIEDSKLKTIISDDIIEMYNSIKNSN